jgi:3-dehydroquinate synthetase
VQIPSDRLFEALSRDKKNVGTSVNLILPSGPGARMEKVAVGLDGEFRHQCQDFLEGLRR